MSRAAAFVLGVCALLTVTAAWLATEGPHAKDWLANRAWVERMPKDKKDMVTWFVPLSVHKKQFGVAQRMSHYAFVGERFTYERKGDKLTLTFQQTDRKVALVAKAYECKGKAPDPFDLCLDLTAGKEKARFYSRKIWRVPGRSDEVPAFDLTPIEAEPCPSCSAADGLAPLLVR